MGIMLTVGLTLRSSHAGDTAGFIEGARPNH